MFGDTWPVVNPFKPQEAWDDSREDIRPEQPLQAPGVPGGPSAAPRCCLRRTPRAQRPPHRPQAVSACLRGLAPAPLLPASARSGSSSPGAHLPLSAGRPSARPPDLSPGVIPLGPPGPSSGFVSQTWASELTASKAGWPCPSAWSPGLGVAPASKGKQGKMGTQHCRVWARSPPAPGADPHVSPQSKDRGPRQQLPCPPRCPGHGRGGPAAERPDGRGDPRLPGGAPP